MPFKNVEDFVYCVLQANDYSGHEMWSIKAQVLGASPISRQWKNLINGISRVIVRRTESPAALEFIFFVEPSGEFTGVSCQSRTVVTDKFHGEEHPWVEELAKWLDDTVVPALHEGLRETARAKLNLSE